MNQPEATGTDGTRRRGPRTLLAIAAIGVAGVLAAGCGDDDDPADAGSDTSAPASDDTSGDGGDATGGDAIGGDGTIEIVSISEAFLPDPATVTAGDEVTWVNTDGVTHTASAVDGTWDSGNIGSGEEFTFAPDEPGTYAYVCNIHPSMGGELVVE